VLFVPAELYFEASPRPQRTLIAYAHPCKPSALLQPQKHKRELQNAQILKFHRFISDKF